MDKKKFSGIILCSMGIIMFIISFSLFSIYSAIPAPMITKLTYNLFSAIFNLSLIPTLLIPVFGIMTMIFSLFSLILGISLIPTFLIPVFGIMTMIFSLFSLILGFDFFHSPFRYQLYVDHFINISFILLLILISGLIYFISCILLFTLKRLARKLIIVYSIILILYFLPISVYLFSDPWGWGGVAAISLLPHILYPLFFIIFFTRPQVKEQFKI